MILPVSDARLVFRPVDHRQDAAAQGLDVDLAQLRRTARAKPPWFLTESCRSPTPTSLAPLDSRCHLSRGRPTRDRPATGPPQSVGLRVPGRLRACAREVSPTGAPGDRRGDPEVRGPADRGPTLRRSTPTPAGSRQSPSISSASASTCVCALSMSPTENDWRGSSRTRRCGSSGPPRCWRGRAPGSATSTCSRRPTRCCAAR